MGWFTGVWNQVNEPAYSIPYIIYIQGPQAHGRRRWSSPGTRFSTWQKRQIGRRTMTNPGIFWIRRISSFKYRSQFPNSHWRNVISSGFYNTWVPQNARIAKSWIHNIRCTLTDLFSCARRCLSVILVKWEQYDFFMGGHPINFSFTSII
mgnify:CR=1 FL=1